MKKIINVLIVFILICLFFVLNFLIKIEINGDTILNKESEEKIVTKIIDGDTIIVQGGETIRLLGIDCDEKGKECYSSAKQRIEELLLNQKVKLVSGKEDKDKYNRKLRYVVLNNENINIKMIKEGFCVARIEQETKYKSEIQNAETFAIENKIGCKWSSLD
jgi:endonuclease YncB( thermonuclease family)